MPAAPAPPRLPRRPNLGEKRQIYERKQGLQSTLFLPQRPRGRKQPIAALLDVALGMPQFQPTVQICCGSAVAGTRRMPSSLPLTATFGIGAAFEFGEPAVRVSTGMTGSRRDTKQQCEERKRSGKTPPRRSHVLVDEGCRTGGAEGSKADTSAEPPGRRIWRRGGAAEAGTDSVSLSKAEGMEEHHALTSPSEHPQQPTKKAQRKKRCTWLAKRHSTLHPIIPLSSVSEFQFCYVPIDIRTTEKYVNDELLLSSTRFSLEGQIRAQQLRGEEGTDVG
ncbi:hypothetical protein E2320_018999 [Naja naja]|nr:hypothetical protein E2320_018999 [Naja naja]